MTLINEAQDATYVHQQQQSCPFRLQHLHPRLRLRLRQHLRLRPLRSGETVASCKSVSTDWLMRLGDATTVGRDHQFYTVCAHIQYGNAP